MKFNIRKNAIVMLAHVYQNCNADLEVETLSLQDIISDTYTTDDVQKAYRYLVGKGYIKSKGKVAFKDISCELLAEGIDWVESSYSEIVGFQLSE